MAFTWAVLYLVFLPVYLLGAVVTGVVVALTHTAMDSVAPALGAIGFIGMFGLYLAAAFTLRRELDSPQIGLSLGGGMIFLFAPIYFQYHLRDYDKPYAPDTGPLGLGLAAQVQPSPVPRGIPVEGQYLSESQAGNFSNAR